MQHQFYKWFCHVCSCRKTPVEKECPSAPTVQDKDGYSTLNMSASMPPRANQDPAFSLTSDIAPVSSATPDLKDESMIMVDCDLYSESVPSQGTENIEPDISPYACFYGAPKQVVKVGWLDKLSPQGWVSPLVSVHFTPTSLLFKWTPNRHQLNEHVFFH